MFTIVVAFLSFRLEQIRTEEIIKPVLLAMRSHPSSASLQKVGGQRG